MNALTHPPLPLLVKTPPQRKVSIPKITLPYMNRFVSIPITQILYIQSDVNYSNIYLKDGRRFLVAKTLKEYNQELKTYPFARIHKSFLVNLDSISSCDFPEYEVHLQNGLCLPIARRKRKVFQQVYHFFQRTQRLAS